MNPQLRENITKVYNTPLPNNPNLTYGSALNPNQLLLYSVATIPALRDKEIAEGRLTQESYDKILKELPGMQAKIDKYNIPPIPYTLEEREPDAYRRIQEGPKTLFGQQFPDALLNESGELDLGPGNEMVPGIVSTPKPPMGFEKRQTIASYGIDPDNPYQFESEQLEKDFYYHLAFAPRNLSKNNIDYITDKLGIKGDLDYLNPLKPHEGFRFKPEGSETYQVLRDPNFNFEDFYSGALRESPAIVGDILGVVATGVKGLGARSIPNALLQLTKASVGSGVGATTGDLARLILGQKLGYNDLDTETMLQEAGMTGLLAIGGTAVIGTVMSALPTAYRVLSGKQISTDILEEIEEILLRQSDVLRQSNKSGLVYTSGTTTAEEINKQIDEFVRLYQKEISSYNPTLSGRNPLDQQAADLEFIYLKHADSKYGLSELYGELQNGNQSVIAQLVRALGDEFADGTVPVGVEVSAGVTKKASENIARFELEGVTALNKIIDDVNQSIPSPKGSLFTKSSKDGIEILPKQATAIAQARDTYLVGAQNSFNDLLNSPRYAELTTGAGYTRKFGKEYGNLKNSTTKLFKRKEAVREIEETLGLSSGNIELLKRLRGQATEGQAKFQSPQFTVKELFELQVVLNEMRINSKIAGSRKFAREAIVDINKQIDKAFNDDIATKLGFKIKTRYTNKELNAIRKYRKDNNYGDDLNFAYRNMEQAYSDVDNVVFSQLLKSGAPEQLIPAILNTNVKGAKINTPVSDFMKVLRTSGDDGEHYVQKEVVDYIQRNILGKGTAKEQSKALKEFLDNNQSTLKAVFPPDKFGLSSITTETTLNRVIKNIEKTDKKINILKNTFGVGQDSVNPVYDIVNRIIRASDGNISTGALANDIDFLLNTIKGDKVLEQQVRQLTKNIILRDIMKLDNTGVAGGFRLDENALNNLLFGKFGPEQLTGPRLTFDDTFGKLLGKDNKQTVEALQLINDIAQRETARDALSEGATLASKRIDTNKPLPGFKFLQRMFIPPLTQFGRRTTAIDVLMTERSQAFIGRMLMDPKLAKETIAFAEGRRSLQNFSNFLASYGTVYYNDIANELQYYDAELKKLKISHRTELTDEINEVIEKLTDEYKR
tara:strand:+ start:1701 stop:5054 length:3354 start_codon:yes stop_codon:yes gene_type:complete